MSPLNRRAFLGRSAALAAAALARREPALVKEGLP